MKCLLLDPITRNGTKTLRVGRCQGKVIVGLWPVIEFGYIGTLLRKQGIEYAILDANHEDLSFDEMMRKVMSYDPDMVVVLGITATLEDDLEIAKRLRLAKKDIYIAFIGTHATVRPQDYLKHPKDIAVVGEPEVTVAELARAINEGTQDFSTIQGVAFPEKEQVFFAPERPFSMDLDFIGIPDHEGMKTHTYLASNTRKPFALIKTSKGCPHQCVFCTVHSVHGAKWRCRSPQAIVEEMKFLKTRYGLKDFFFQSDVFGQKREWVVELCETILKQDLKVTWFSNSRADEVDFELVSLMKRSGCKLLAFGLESFSDRVLEACKKGITAEQNVLAIEACRKAKSVDCIVVASSDKAYGEQETLPYTEGMSLRPTFPYETSKACADLISQCFAITYEMPISIIRCSNVYGGGDLNFSRIIPGTIKAVLHGQRPVIRSDGTPMRDYIYIEDVVSAYISLAQATCKSGLCGEAFNIGLGKPISVLELTKLILDLCGASELEPIIEGVGKPMKEIRCQYVSIEKARSILGWYPKHDLKEGLIKTIDWYRSFFGIQRGTGTWA